MQKRAVGDWIIKRKHLSQMRSGWPELAAIHQVSAGRAVTQNEAGGIIALTAQTQQFFVQAQRYIGFAAVYLIAGLQKGNLKELRGRTHLLPELSCAGIGMARFRRRVAFEDMQHRAQGAVKFELLSLS